MAVIRHHRPDAFFDETQQQRLADLMARWRTARDSGTDLPAAEQAELDALVEEELLASQKRTTDLV